jgi:hypothetical protein
MSPNPVQAANRPQYSNGNPVPSFIDSTTLEWSRGLNPVTGAKGAEPAEAVPVITAISGGNLPTAGGGAARTVTGTNLGGSTGMTIGGVAVTSWTVVDEEHATFVPGAHAAGAVDAIVQNPAGNSAGFSVTYA